jgi:hypothetical protein
MTLRVIGQCFLQSLLSFLLILQLEAMSSSMREIFALRDIRLRSRFGAVFQSLGDVRLPRPSL